MAYNPGVQDNRGQIWAQGIGQFAQGAARGIEQYGQRMEENKALTSQAKALETLLPLYAQKSGVTPEEIEAFLQPSPDETPRGRVMRLSSTIEGIVANAALQSRQLNDELIRTNTVSAQQNQEQNTQAFPVELAHKQVQTQRMQAEIDQMLRADPQFRPEIVDLGNGVTAMMTSPRSAVPINKGAAPKHVPGQGGLKMIELPGVGTMVVDAQTGEPIPSSRVVRPQNSGQKIDPLMVGTLSEQIAKLEAEKTEHQREMVKGDQRTGFLNLKSRQDRLKEIDQQLAGLRATLNAGSKGAATPAPVAPETPSSSARPKPLASPYTSAEVQAELRRRGMIQ